MSKPVFNNFIYIIRIIVWANTYIKYYHITILQCGYSAKTYYPIFIISWSTYLNNAQYEYGSDIYYWHNLHQQRLTKNGIDYRTWKTLHKLWDVIIHPCPNFNNGFIQASLGCVCNYTPHRRVLSLLIYVLIIYEQLIQVNHLCY